MLFFIHLKPEIALAIPASNKWQILLNMLTFILIFTAFFSVDDDLLITEPDMNHAFDIWKVRINAATCCSF